MDQATPPTTERAEGHETKPPTEQLHFRISSGLKRLIGRDLITDEFVAIFELVKNSFDAAATRVDLLFVGDKLLVIDDGKGMSRSDIEQKWLFVAYSAKRDGTEDDEFPSDYRDKLGTSRRPYAGSKGVGRFSCDRLGRRLRLQTRRASSQDHVDSIEVNWDLFEQDDKQEFVKIPVTFRTFSEFQLPPAKKPPKAGTVLEISELRQVWNREKLLQLKAALSKLINPFGTLATEFSIWIDAPTELAQDKRVTGLSFFHGNIPESAYTKAVNGRVKNFIFEALGEKTTFITVEVADEGESLVATLTDRGEEIFKIREKNPYERLRASGFRCQIFYLNLAAKTTFTRRMGIQPVKFGSVFLFRNGFRVFPIGEEGDDSFGIDRRKQQGTRRFLGTRDIIGRIDVSGDEEDFKEATSRDHGLVNTPAAVQLEDCFWEKCLKRLERYVVGVSWPDSADKRTEDISRLLGDSGSARVSDVVAKLVDVEGVELLSYSPRLIRILNEKSEDFRSSIAALRVVAEKTSDKKLLNNLSQAEVRYNEIQRAEAEARKQAEAERQARETAERRAREAEEAKRTAERQYEEEQKRSLFLASVSSVDYETIVNLHHQITIYASDIHHLISHQIDQIRHGESPTDEDLISLFENMAFKNQKVLATARFATKANFRLDADEIETDIVTYIMEYLDRVCPMFAGDGLELQTTSSAKGLVRRFKPIEVAILLDNLISNAKKAGASRVEFTLSQPHPSEIDVMVEDNGEGLDPSIRKPQLIFDKGFSTTSGSGLGLFHVSHVLDQMGGSISVERKPGTGAVFRIRIST